MSRGDEIWRVIEQSCDSVTIFNLALFNRVKVKLGLLAMMVCRLVNVSKTTFNEAYLPVNTERGGKLIY